MNGLLRYGFGLNHQLMRAVPADNGRVITLRVHYYH